MLNDESLLIDFRDVCRLLSISVGHFYNLRDTGKFPVKPLRLGRSVRYDKRHIMSWIDSGCSINWRPKR